MKPLPEMMARFSGKAGGARASAAVDRLTDLADFSPNPGALKARTYVPAGLKAGAALVVVLHGCTQTAAGYDHGSGWSTLAERHGFALLYPEQNYANNPNGCFTWFLPEDTRRDGGEAMSIRQMIGAMVTGHGIDPARIFVTGLSAGGAMAGVMLAAYPELFAGGAIVAGLPYGVARSVPQALERMRSGAAPDGEALAASVRAASSHRGPWPVVSVWHGSGDATVHPSNADAIVAQWRTLHGLAAKPTRHDMVDGHPYRAWCDADGRVAVEEYSITGMAHGTPLSTRGDDPCGTATAFMLEAGISSTRHIAAGWGLLGEPAARASVETAAPERALATTEPLHAARANPRLYKVEPRPAPAGGVAKVIDDALRAAGLLR